MKLKKYMPLSVCFMMVLLVMVSFSGADTVVMKKQAKKQIEDEYSDIDKALNQSAEGGKVAGAVSMEEPFVDNFSGGLSQEIDDTVRSQNELESKEY